MKRVAVTIISVALFLVACSQKANNPDAISTTVAMAAQMTLEAITTTPFPTITPDIYSVINNSEQSRIGLISWEDGTFNFPTIEIYEVYKTLNIGYLKPSNGKVFAIIKLKIHNSGGIGVFSSSNFIVIDDEGIFLEPTLSSLDCELGYETKAMDGSTLDRCLVFEIIPNSTFTFVYAPYEDDPYNPERILQWEITIR